MPTKATADADLDTYSLLNARCILPKATVTAAGSSQGTAAALSAGYNAVAGADGTKGVILFDPTPGGTLTIVDNQSANSPLAVYPPSGKTLDGGATNSPIWVPPGATLCYGNSWRSNRLRSTIRTVTDADGAVVEGDDGGMILMDSASDHNIVIPANASTPLRVGFNCRVMRMNIGNVTTTITSDTLRSVGSLVRASAQYSVIGLEKIATTTWVVYGDRA